MHPPPLMVVYHRLKDQMRQAPQLLVKMLSGDTNVR